MIGKKFGKLEVLGCAKNVKYKYTCKCECGNIVDIYSFNLRSGRTKSCGCEKKKIHIDNGTRFNRLTVICKSEVTDKYRREFYKCKCDCGNIVNVAKNSIISNSTKSCGCLKTKYKNIIGMKFGLLTVKAKDIVIENRLYYYKCDCECGTKDIIISRSNLVSGYTKSCGCLRKKENRIKYKALLEQNENRKEVV